ncbi:sensor histidine kinase [Fibrisoma limi]|nr:histidine kinase [Fibrisoma limi]
MVSPFRKWFRVVGTPIMGLLIYLIVYYVDPKSFEVPPYVGTGAWKAYCFDICSCLIGAYILSELSLWSTDQLNRILPWEDRPLLRFMVQLITLIIDSVVVIGGIVWVIILIEEPDYRFTEADWLSIRQTFAFGSLMALFINALQTGEYFFTRWRTSMLEAERLKRESVEARFEALKGQLDPHFLFNNLNTLSYIVEENPRRAVAFIESLSLVYRYVLQNRDKTLVPLRDELKLAEAYLFLLKNRFEEGLQVTIDVPDCDRDRLIPPMTLQLLLENAVKHNVVNEQHPLHITLTCNESGELVVQNSLHRRQHVEAGTGIGLQNIRHRYELLINKQPAVVENGQSFTVRLPLIGT